VSDPVVVRTDDGWYAHGSSADLVVGLAARRSWPDGLRGEWSAGVPPEGLTERPIEVDQTQRSFVVGESVVVKWTTTPSAHESPAPRLTTHLAAVGFRAQPSPLGHLVLDAPDGTPVVLASVTGYLPGAKDGWEWYVDDVRTHARGHPIDVLTPAAALGRLTADLHAALATPSVYIRSPRGAASVRPWHERALAALDEAVQLTGGVEGERLRALEPQARDVIDNLRNVDTARVQPIHGDLHVGQILRWRGGYAVNDFDGNPVLSPEERLAKQSTARDVAGMLQSLDHVGRVALRHAPDADAQLVETWITEARSAYLTAYRETQSDLLDERLLAAFAVEQECREYVYAARHLSRWLYVPDAALPALLGLTG
jgi:maltokinase